MNLEPLQESFLSFQKSATKQIQGFVIGTTAHFNSTGDYYTTPNRETELVSYFGVVVKDVNAAKDIAAFIDGKVNYVFVDTEKKIPKANYGDGDVGNLEKALSPFIEKSQMLAFKGNDLTVRATDVLLRSLLPDATSIKIAIIGVGSVGTKVALSLLERGASVQLFSRDASHADKTAGLLNAIKPSSVLVCCSSAKDIKDAFINASTVIATTSMKNFITQDLVELCKLPDSWTSPILIDVGKGCFTREVLKQNQIVYRVDIEEELNSDIDALVRMNSLLKIEPFLQYTEKSRLVRRGLVGLPGDLIVDNPKRPIRIVGECAENGLLIPYQREKPNKM